MLTLYNGDLNCIYAFIFIISFIPSFFIFYVSPRPHHVHKRMDILHYYAALPSMPHSVLHPVHLSVLCLRFTRNWRAVQTLNLVERWLWTRVTGGVNLRKN